MGPLRAAAAAASYDGHTLKLVTELGYVYEPSRRMDGFELSMDAFLRTLTGDVFKRCPLIQDRLGTPSTKLRGQFKSHVTAMCEAGNTSGIGEWLSRKVVARAIKSTTTAEDRRVAATVAAAASLNTREPCLRFDDVVSEFLKTHHGPEYSMANEAWLDQQGSEGYKHRPRSLRNAKILRAPARPRPFSQEGKVAAVWIDSGCLTLRMEWSRGRAETWGNCGCDRQTAKGHRTGDQDRLQPRPDSPIQASPTSEADRGGG